MIVKLGKRDSTTGGFQCPHCKHWVFADYFKGENFKKREGGFEKK